MRIGTEGRSRQSLHIEPAAGSWRIALDARRHTAASRRFREQLGLPTDRPIVMSGHQAQFWHPGILAKYLAMHEGAKAVGGAPVWLTVDQDAADPWAIRAPTPTAERIDLRLGPIAAADMPACGLPPTTAPAAGVEGRLAELLPDAARGVRAIARALSIHSGAPDAATQVAAALRDLIAPVCPPAIDLMATSLARTDLFKEMVASMQADAAGCTRAYNGAVSAHPGAGVRPLNTGAGVELPLWKITRAAPRGRVHAHELTTIDPSELAPKALLMTALLRACGCDLFVHGLGGGVYDRVTEAWFGAWRPDWKLSPTAVVTATRHLSFSGLAAVPTPEEIALARWRAHRAGHDPALLGDSDAAAEKRALVAQIAAAKAAGGRTLELYQQMHEMLAGVRSRSESALIALKHRAATLAERGAQAAVVFDRTWPFPMYPGESLAALAAEVRRGFAGTYPP